MIAANAPQVVCLICTPSFNSKVANPSLSLFMVVSRQVKHKEWLVLKNDAIAQLSGYVIVLKLKSSAILFCGCLPFIAAICTLTV